MSRSQGAANGGWQAQRHPAAEPDPRSGGRPAQRQQAPQYANPPQHPAPYPQQAYEEQQAPPPYGAAPQAYHYPQQPQYAPAAPAPVAPPAPVNRQGLSSLDSARNAQPAPDFENYPRTQPPQYARQQQHAPQPAYAPPAGNPMHAAGYRQAPPPAAPQYGAPTGYEQWPTQEAYAPQDHAGYLPGDAPFPANSNQPYVDPLQQADWSMPAATYGDPGLDQQSYGRGQLGYEQGHAGALEPTYNSAEAAAYEGDEPRRASWTMRIAGAIVVAIGLGYGLAQAYKSVLGTPSDTPPPVVASDASPAREKPSDPGGKQFSHPDSKVLGRLSDGDQGAQEASSGGLSEADASGNGARQVKTLVVGRDGSIAPPEAGPEPEPTVSVPGLTVVDAFGSAGGPQHAAPTGPPPRQAEPEAAPAEPPRARVNVKSTKVLPASPSSTASIPEDDAAPVPAAPKKQKVAAAPAASDEGATSPSGANGYVVVLASVPASGSSRLDALRKFADLQQQYGAVLSNKTPDVRETTLAGKGPYHRLLVGPPGSRSQASELCMQLKASGYKDCWVTAY
jgi:hypothetical protein